METYLNIDLYYPSVTLTRIFIIFRLDSLVSDIWFVIFGLGFLF